MRKKLGLVLLALGLSLTALPAKAGETGQSAQAAAGETETVRSGILSVQVPESILQICDVVTEENRIAFYEKISHEKFGGGFVGDIKAYESVMDYSFLPKFRRVGEIMSGDGTKYNIVVQGPTDVQFDMNSEQSIGNYSIIMDAFETVITDSLQAAEGTFIPQAETDTTSIYDNVLDRLTEDIQSRKTPEELMEDEFSYLYAYSYDGESDPLDVIGYSFIDLNYDGYAELILGMSQDPMIYDVFTQTDGEVTHSLGSQERDRWSIVSLEYGSVMMRRDGSGGASLSETAIYAPGPGMDSCLQVAFVYDADRNPSNPFFVKYLENSDDLENVSEQDWVTRLGFYGTILTPEYRPLSER